MNKIDLIIDALESAYEDKAGWCDKVNEALYAAHALKALKPVAIRNPINGMIEIQWGASESVPLGTKLYALDEVTK